MSLSRASAVLVDDVEADADHGGGGAADQNGEVELLAVLSAGTATLAGQEVIAVVARLLWFRPKHFGGVWTDLA